MLDRTRWSAIGAAIAVALAGGVALPSARASNTTGGGAGVVFVPIVPCRLFDTRAAAPPIGPRTVPLGAGDTYTQSVTGTNGNCTIPAGATAVAMNVTTDNASAASFLTIWPEDATQPLASNLNWVPGAAPTPNKVDVKLSAAGKIKLFNKSGTVDVLADVVGYYADHDHDDRYYTKAETDARIDAADAQQITIMPPSVLTLRQTAAIPGTAAEPTAIAECVGNKGIGGEGRIPLTVPFPALHMGVAVNVLDGAGLFPIRVALVKLTPTPAGLTATELDFETFPGDLNGQVVHANLDLPAGQTIDGTGMYEVSITGIENTGKNAYCGGALIILTQENSPIITG
jgi:hypothetical protein